MASYHATVTTPRPADEVFAFVADFSNLTEWDPSMKRSEHTGGASPLQVGAHFHVVVDTSLKDTEMDYKTVEIDAPRRVVLHGESGGVTSIDTITVEDTGAGATVTYEAELDLSGVAKVLDPALQIAFNRMGAKAADGLAEALDGEVTETS